MLGDSQMMPGRLACLGWVCLLAFSLGGCQSKPREGDVFGFIAECPQGTWEDCRRKRHVSERASIEPYQKMLDDTFADVFVFSPSYTADSHKLFEREVVSDPLTAFMFEAYRFRGNDGEKRVIRTSSETFATITKMAMVRHFTGLPKIGDEWPPKYLLYIRNTADGAAIMDPLRASGLITMNGEVRPGVPDFTDAIRQGINDTYSVVSFLVAHEIYHLDNPFACAAATDECLARRRQHETDADTFAIDVLGKLAAQDPEPDHRLGVPIYVFSQLMLVMQGARVSVAPATHPPNHERLRSAARALDKWIKAHPASPSAPSLRLLADQALKIVKDIDTEGPNAYFAGVDEEASEVTLASLRVY